MAAGLLLPSTTREDDSEQNPGNLDGGHDDGHHRVRGDGLGRRRLACGRTQRFKTDVVSAFRRT
jgi:hypothetical protein